MPRTLAPTLLQCLRRANPNVATFVEVAAPDQGQTLRRAPDQLLAAPSLISMTPAASAVASPAGALTLAATDQLLITQYTDNGIYNIPQEDGGPTLLHTVAWQLDPAFGGCVLSSVTALLHWTSASFFNLGPNVKLQLYRATQIAGVLQRQVGSSVVETKATQYSFAPLLQEPVLLRYADLVAQGVVNAGTGFGDVTFDLTPYRIQIDPTSAPPPGPGQTGDLPEIYFSITTDQQGAGNLVEWRFDTTSAQTIAGVGLVREKTWTRTNPNDPASLWVPNVNGRALTFKLKVRQYSVTSQVVYLVTLPALPLAGSVGRIVFSKSLPTGTAATLELSTAGAGGPFTPVANGDVVATPQLTYHLRLTMTASADQRRAPLVSAIGVEFRNLVDVSAESTVQHMTQDVAVPFLQASVGEGRVDIVRTGRRDYHDPGTELAVVGADTQLETDIFLASRHPAVGRADWFRMARAQVSNRQPSATSESFTLLSLVKRLKRKIPRREETINTAYKVASATTTQITILVVGGVSLIGTTLAGNEYDGKNYYIRVRKSVVAGVNTGLIFTISGNTGTDKLDFTGSLALPAAFAVGDEIEVHSGQYQQPPLSWVERDPADIWWELLTVYLGIPSDRIGLSDIGTAGRAGLPPKVTDRAPGDPATQAKLLVSLKLTAAENGDELVDQVSFLMGGTTIEIAGQIVFRQIYPLRDASGNITVPLDRVAVVFDPRDYAALEVPTGREARITVLACDYGVNTVGAASAPVSTVQYVDADALAAYELQDVEGLGTAAVPDAIARWCYNRTDGGLFLASCLAQQVVLATSTGLRVWPWTSVEAYPGLTVGDTVVVVTNQYTDYDPGRRVAIRGWNAYPLTIVGTSEGGRRFKGLLQGLAGITGVRLRGGAGTLADPTSLAAQYAFRDLRRTDADTTSTFSFTTIAPEVYGGYLVIDAPETAADADLLAAAMHPLPPGATSFTVPRPIDQQITLVRLDALFSDLVIADSLKLEITATPQVPHPEYDDVETATVGTEWIGYTERGIAIVLVQAQIQVETSQFTSFAAPSRGPGGVSVVKGGVLGPNEYEQDVPLSAIKGRQSFIRFQALLENDAPPLTSPDFAFDANKVPNIMRAIPTPGTAILPLEGDSDVQSWRVVSGSYVMVRDGQFIALDLSLADDAGTAGLASNTSATFTVTAYNVPSGQQTTVPGPGYRLSTSTDVFVYNGTGTGGTGGSPAATWATFTVAPPSADGLSDLTVTLKATSAPGGWTVKIFLRDPNSATAVNITASTVPAAGAVPVVNTSYVYTLPFPRLPSDDPFAVTRYVGVIAQLWNGGSLMYTQTRVVSYLASSAS